MRTDAELQNDLLKELKWDPSVRDEEIAVVVREGVVTLGGSVDSYAAKFAAVRAAERVGGVRAVADELAVILPTASTRSDTDLAHQAASALRWHTQVPDEKIKARVADGWVTLDGEVDWDYQRHAAYDAVRTLTGVRGVTNLITIHPQASPYDVSQRIKDALRRQAELDAALITVEARDGRVTLRGAVRSWAERRDVERAVWAAPGVTSLDDQLVVHL